jgi:hypothetical protein
MPAPSHPDLDRIPAPVAEASWRWPGWLTLPQRLGEFVLAFDLGTVEVVGHGRSPVLM